MKVIAIANKKGGVGKTTTAVNLSCGLAKKGYRVLAIDLDQQGHLTKSFGFDVEKMGTVNTAFEWLMNSLPLDIVVQRKNNIDVVMADISLAALDAELQRKLKREYVLCREINKVFPNYDYVVIDCPPSLGNITINILTAADRVVIPFRPDFLSKDGVYALLETVKEIQEQEINARLKISGFLPTMVDKRCNNETSFMEANNLANQYGGVVFGEGIRLAKVLADAPGKGLSIFDYAPDSPAAQDYQAFIDKFLEIEGEKK